jgi:LysR family transcriptional regulator, glycine cleavage system transcriptional activator
MRTPNLNGLRAFEAAGRLLSMKAAADTLHVSPSAVSQLIRTLELELGVSLFRRGHRTLSLTPAGQTLLSATANGLRLIVDASERIRREPEGVLLTLSTTAFFAESWLVPRLPAFEAAFPHVDLHVSTGASLASLRDGDADIGIRHGLGAYPGMQSDLIIAPPIVPVASSEFLRGRAPPRGPAGLLTWPKVHDADRRAWSEWFAFHGIACDEPARGPSFDDAAPLVAAVRAGRGAGLLPVLMRQATNDLVPVGEPAAISNLGYYLVAPTDALRRPLLAAFRDWVLAQSQSPA